MAIANTNLFMVATKINTIFILTKRGGKQLAIANANFISGCCEDECCFIFLLKKKGNNWL